MFFRAIPAPLIRFARKGSRRTSYRSLRPNSRSPRGSRGWRWDVKEEPRLSAPSSRDRPRDLDGGLQSSQEQFTISLKQNIPPCIIFSPILVSSRVKTRYINAKIFLALSGEVYKMPQVLRPRQRVCQVWHSQ